MLKQGNGIKEFGISNVIHDTYYLLGSTQQGGATSTITTGNAFFEKPEKHDFLQNASFPLPSGQKMFIKAMAITTDFADVLTDLEFRTFLENAYILITLNNKEYAKMPVWNYYLPFAQDEMPPKPSYWTKLEAPIEVDESGKWKIQLVTPQFTTTAISTTTGQQLGTGVVDSANTPIKVFKVWFTGDWERP